MKDLNDRWEDEVYSIAAERREALHITARIYFNQLERRVARLEREAFSRAYKRSRAAEERYSKGSRDDPEN